MADDFSKRFNTNLSNEQEANYQLWLLEQSGKRGRDMSKDEADYDMRGYYKAGVGLDNADGHFPDTHKKPNHPTFSVESEYHGAKAPGGGQYIGGRWGEGTFAPSSEMLNSTHKERDLQRYFKQHEPDTQLLLPQNNAPAIEPAANDMSLLPHPMLMAQNTIPQALGRRFQRDGDSSILENNANRGEPVGTLPTPNMQPANQGVTREERLRRNEQTNRGPTDPVMRLQMGLPPLR